METLIFTAGLGLIIMLAELAGLRKWMMEIAVAGLIIILGYHVWNTADGTAYFNDMFRRDFFFYAFSAVLIGLFIPVLLLNKSLIHEQEQHTSDYIAIYLFTLAGAIILTGYSNLAMLFLGIEIVSISLYILAGSRKSDVASNEAGMKYFLMGSFASAILLFGIALVYGASGSFHLQAIHDGLRTLSDGNLSMLQVGFWMITFGLLFKVAAAPFHYWSPDVYQGSPVSVTLFMATIAKIAAAVAFFRLVFLALGPMMYSIEVMLQVVIAASLIIGNLLALVQSNFKRMMAYSGISHASYMLMIVLCLPDASASLLAYYALAYGFAAIVAIGAGMVVFRGRNSEEFIVFRGLFRRSPWLATCVSLAMLSLGGIPPVAGFWAKYFVFSEAISQGYGWLTVVAILNTMVAVFYYFKVMVEMVKSPEIYTPPSISWSEKASISAAAIGLIVLGLVPSLIIQFWQ